MKLEIAKSIYFHFFFQLKFFCLLLQVSKHSKVTTSMSASDPWAPTYFLLEIDFDED